ncbi:MAG: M20 family metallo-hydrolase [Armatimonadetes bacterium]|nr:M20 family metallo-hydrolase [Akkermansiaceae bacterium]
MVIQHLPGKLMDGEILRRAIERIDELGRISDMPGELRRTFLSKANLAAGACVMKWMGGLGMEVAHDAGGTVRGILPGNGHTSRAIIIGSHLDTVIDAGKYDGALGIICALAALELLRKEGCKLDYPVHLLGFSDEEGVRFQSAYLGSAGVAGLLGPDLLAVRDEAGKTLAEVLLTEGWKAGAEVFSYDEFSSSGYLELHIEQGRVLEEAGEAIAIVSGIRGQARLRVTVEGLADHAGTTPMNLRRDALTGAAECVLMAEGLARESSALVATAGTFKVRPGASNVIPQLAEFTLDVRHMEDGFLNDSLERMRRNFTAICERRGLRLGWNPVQINHAVNCDERMIAELLDCAESVTGKRRLLGSGAGHDGVMMSKVMPVGMIFVRCRAGLSHHPDEHVEADDIGKGIEVMAEFLKRRNA